MKYFKSVSECKRGLPENKDQKWFDKVLKIRKSKPALLGPDMTRELKPRC